MDRRNLNRNHNYKRNNNRRDDDNLKEEMMDHTKDFKETYAKAKELGSSLTVIEEIYSNTPKKIVKSHIVYDSFYLN